MLCKKCGLEFDGNFCPNCGNAKEDTHKWYQKNSPLTITIMIVALLFLAVSLFIFLTL